MNLILALSYIKRESNKLAVIFVDSEKLTTLLEVLKEFGLDNKTRAIIQQYLSNTISKVKFMGEISDAFEIRAGVRQGNGLSPLLFNSVLEKVICEWRKGVSGRGVENVVRFGYRRMNLIVDCLPFTDELAIFFDLLDRAAEQINELKTQTANRQTQRRDSISP